MAQHGQNSFQSSNLTVSKLPQLKILALFTLDLDVAGVLRIIDSQPGQVLLVGHSYSGAVITEAGVYPKVSGLVYAAVFGSETGDTPSPNLQITPPPKHSKRLRKSVGDSFN